MGEYGVYWVDSEALKQILAAAMIQASVYKDRPDWIDTCKDLEMRIGSKAIVIAD